MQRFTFVFSVLILLLGWALSVYAQSFTLTGYIKELPSVVPNNDWSDATVDNLLHNRLNLRWYPSMSLTAGLELRTRLYIGETVDDTEDFGDFIDTTDEFVNLSRVVYEDGPVLLHSMIDRLWLDYYSGDWQIRAGRQRVNWGLNLVWNPHDLFNAYSLFDFDYEERPGVDGLRVQYYTGIASKAEIAIKLADDSEDVVAAGLYRFNKWEYDFQFIAGRYAGEQLAVGAGWAGDIAGGGFRGETSYFVPENDSDGDPYLVSAISGDYTFENSLYLHAAALYNERGSTGKAGATSLLEPLPANQLSPARHSLYGQLSYQLSPLLTGDLSGILNPHDHSYYIGPSLSWSVKTNWDLLLIAQFYQGDDGTEFGDLGELLFARLKWSF